MSTELGEKMYEAYKDGASIEELNDIMADASATDTQDEAIAFSEESGTLEEQPEALETNNEPENDGGNGKPYLRDNTHAGFQKVFDRAWNKRHGETQAQMQRLTAENSEIKELLASLLKVDKEKALEELKNRRFAVEAEEQGYQNPEQYTALRKAQAEVEALKREKEQGEINKVIEDIRRQGDALSSKVSSFVLDDAMENDTFRNLVFSLQRNGEENAVEKAYRAVYFEDFLKTKAQTEKKARPQEGGAQSKTSGTLKASDISKMSREQILDIEARILRGETVNI